MIKNNIILLYFVYIITLMILCIIDASILLYYIFWILNIFLYPLLWLMLKIIFFNRYIFLLLLFYFLLAKYTIAIPGYKYFEFFGMDVKKLYENYLNNLFSITIYHIEMLSIFIFFIIVIAPFIYYNELAVVVVCLSFIFSILLFKTYKSRLHHYEKRSQKFLNLVVGWFVIFIIFKITNFQHYKDIFTIYMHFDEWVFNFLELKICMYKEPEPKIKGSFFFSYKVKPKPIWYVEKINIKDKWYEREWYYLKFKKIIKIFEELEYKWLIIKEQYISNYKFFFRNKYIDKQLFNKLKFLENEKKQILKFKNKNEKVNYKKDVRFWNFKRLNENATFEKELEYYAHRAIISKNYLSYSLLNYYKFNDLLEYLSIKKSIYYESFFDEQKNKVHKFKWKRNNFYYYINRRFAFQDTVDLLDDILYKIEKNKEYIKKHKKEEKFNDSFLLKKIYKYSIAKKMRERTLRASGISDLLDKLDDRISLKKNWYNIDFENKYKKQILNKDRNISIKTSPLLIFPKYVRRDDLEKLDNKLLLNTLEKYQKKEINKHSKYKKKESSFILKKNEKTDLVINPGPDLSRREKK